MLTALLVTSLVVSSLEPPTADPSPPAAEREGEAAAPAGGSAPPTGSSQRGDTESSAVELVKEQAARQRAEEAAERAKAETEAVRAELDSEKSAKLLEFGLTVGTAFAVQAPVIPEGTASNRLHQRTASVTAMPYLMLLPGFWTGNGYVRKYCASQWAGKSEVTASRAADALAREKAKQHLEVLLDAIRSSNGKIELEELKNEEPRSRGLEHLTEEQHEAAKALLGETDPAKRELLREALETELMTTVVGWTPGLPAKACAARKIGAWVGIPVKYEARIEGRPFGVAVDTKSEIDPVVAFGLGYTPNAYVSVLVGGSYNRATVASSMTDPDARNDRGLWTITVGLGLNADILTLLRGK